MECLKALSFWPSKISPMPLTQNELQEYDIHRLFAKYKVHIFCIHDLPTAIKDHLGMGLDAIFQAWVRDGFLTELHEPGYYEYTQVARNRYKHLKNTYKHQKLEQRAFWFLVVCGLVGALGGVPSIRQALFSKSEQSPKSAPIQSPPSISHPPPMPPSHTTDHYQDSGVKKSK
jgi:hypothetical protein